MLETTLIDAVNIKYGENPPHFVLTRMEKECRYIYSCGLSDELFAYYKLACWMRDNRYPYWLCGTTAACFLLHLLGVSAANPLPAHYYCPACGRTVLGKKALNGFDLPVQICECGNTMTRDGHNIAFEQFQGRPASRKSSNGAYTYLFMDVPPEVHQDVVSFLKTRPELQNKEFLESDAGDATRVGMIQIISDSMLPPKKKDWFKSFSADDVRNYALCNYTNLIPLVESKLVKPCDFLDVIKLFGLIQGNWTFEADMTQLEEANGIAYVVRTLFDNSLKKIPAFSDDVFDALTAAGMPADKAWAETDTVRFGDSLSRDAMDQLGDYGLVVWCNRASYLFPRVNAIEYCIARYKIAR